MPKLIATTFFEPHPGAGTGASDPAPKEKRDAVDVITDLSALLEAASVVGPYVVLGRSFGGLIVTYYAQEMPEDVLGVGHVSASPPAELAKGREHEAGREADPLERILGPGSKPRPAVSSTCT